MTTLTIKQINAALLQRDQPSLCYRQRMASSLAEIDLHHRNLAIEAADRIAALEAEKYTLEYQVKWLQELMAEQRQGEPVKTPARDESLGTAERDEYANGYRHGWNAYSDEMAKLGPLYTHSDSGEVELLRAELDQRNREKSARQDLSISLIDEARSLRAEFERLREELGLIKISFDRNFDAAQEAKAERDTLRAQLANWQALAAERMEMITGRDALLRDLDEAWNAHDGEKLFGKLMMKVEALSASAEPKPICETCQGTWSKEQCQGCFK